MEHSFWLHIKIILLFLKLLKLDFFVTARMGQLERSPDLRLQACFLFFLSASLVIQTAYLLYHLWGLLTLGLERFQGKSTDAKHRQVRSWLAAGFGWEPMLNYVFWDIFNE